MRIACFPGRHSLRYSKFRETQSTGREPGDIIVQRFQATPGNVRVSAGLRPRLGANNTTAAAGAEATKETKTLCLLPEIQHLLLAISKHCGTAAARRYPQAEPPKGHRRLRAQAGWVCRQILE